MSGERERRAAVVEYWRAVELFSPQKVPTVSSRERVYEVAVDRALPWEETLVRNSWVSLRVGS